MIRKFFIGLLSVLLVSVMAFGGYAWYLYNHASETAKEIHKPLKRSKSPFRNQDLNLDKGQPVSFLLVGVDERDGDQGRTDTMLVVTVNPTTKQTNMLSIPRDTYTEIVGHGTTEKINHAYAYGGIEMSIRSVENLLQVPIDYYIEINMQGLKQMVDELGGITVDSPLEFTFKEYGKSYHFKKGKNKLSGEEALAFVRMRKEDPNGDFGRNTRQRIVLEAVMKKGMDLSSITKFKGMIDAVGKHAKTNLVFDEMKTLFEDYRDAGKHIEQVTFKGEGDTEDGLWVFKPNEDSLSSVRKKLRENLGSNTVKPIVKSEQQ